MASVKVAVRVRPFNLREKDMNSKVIIQMDGKKTRISNPKASTDNAPDAHKDFTFDHSYWSFDPAAPQFSSQEQVFNDLGMDVVDAAFEGYNACVFAYGQTGSGKTFTMMGSKDSRGLIPRICEALFQRMSGGSSSYRTEVSYLEIYNEKVSDLLGTGPASQGLRIRENPKLGIVVQDLSRHLVTEYDQVESLMGKGNLVRTTASTNMNDVSSRSHAIFTLHFVKAGYTNNTPTETVSKVHLVDLAGSERADATGATGDRLKEGAHINKSLVTLGSVISSLAELSNKKTTFIPYRDSVLTWLLKDSLGGNSKTIMIAAISPADVNYSETLSTLRYANRAKNIINKPTVNEDPNTRIIRELHDEITKLKAMLSNGTMQPQMLAALQAKQEQEKVLTEEWAEKWRETQKILQEQRALGLRLGKDGTGVVLDSNRPHLVRIDDDLTSTGVTLYDLKEGENILGSEEADIVLNEEGVEPLHCRIVLSPDGVATLIPHGECYLNGQFIEKHTRLNQGCLIVMGNSIMLRYNNPAEAELLRKDPSHLSKSTNDLSALKCNSSEDGDRMSVRDENENNLKSPESLRSPPKDSCKNFLMRRSSMMGINQISDSESVPDEEMKQSHTSFRRQAMRRAKENPLQNYTKASDVESDDSEDAQGRGGKFLSNRRASTYDPLFSSSPLHPNVNGSNIDIMRSIMARSMPCLSDRFYDGDPNELSASIPTYVLRGVGTQTHHEYEVRLAVGHERYTIMRRYNRFRELHSEMMHKYGEQVAALLFPPKKFSLLRRSEALARERRPQLESYLSRLLEVVSRIPGSPLNTQTPSRTDLYALSSFFKKGVFETGKYGTS